MAGAVAESLSRFHLATWADEKEIARLQRENAMGSAIRLSMECQYGDADQVIVGRRAAGGLYGMGVRTVRPMYVNGELQPVGYLGGLRLDPDYRGNPRALIGGYQLFRELHEADGHTQLYLTSILSDNTVARRFLEANVRGMPTYRLVGEYVTLIMGIPWWVRSKPTDGNAEFVQPLLDRHLPQFQFSSPVNLPPGQFRVVPGGCGSVWSRTPYRKVVVRGYAPWLRFARSYHNVLIPLFGRPHLPDPGRTLSMGYVTNLATDSVAAAVQTVATMRADAAAGSLQYLVAGFDARDPRLPAIRRRFGGRTIRSRLYIVYWPDGRSAADALDGRLAGPEVALL